MGSENEDKQTNFSIGEKRYAFHRALNNGHLASSLPSYRRMLDGATPHSLRLQFSSSISSNVLDSHMVQSTGNELQANPKS
jgi:hypothetical protein